jgi:5'-3' exonuclease
MNQAWGLRGARFQCQLIIFPIEETYGLSNTGWARGYARAPRSHAGSMSRVGTLMLLDTASLYFRAFYGVPETMTAPDGTPVNAVRGLLDMIARLVRSRRPGRLIACMDADWRPAFRVAAVPSYKQHRAQPDGTEQVPDSLSAQIPVIEEVLGAAGVAMAAAAGFEADDVIATLAAREPAPIDVVTGDRDLFQLVDDARPVRVLYTARGFAKLEVVDEKAVTGRYQIPGRAYAAFAALRGDPSDGLPGVPGVGEKTAAALVRVFGTVEAMLTALDQGHGGFPMSSRAKLAGARDYLDAVLPVVRTAADAPVPPVDGRLPAAPADPRRLAELDARWDLGSSLGRMLAAFAAARG